MMTFWHNTTTLFGEALNGMAQPWVICMALVLTTLLLEDLAIAAGVAARAAPGAKVLAVVKANAYGHGLTRVLPALDDADGLALVELDAASTLRERHYTRRILLIEGFFEERELPELDDEFAQLASEFDTLEELKADLVKDAERGKRFGQGMQARDKVMEALMAAVEIPIPEGVVNDEVCLLYTSPSPRDS